MVTGPAMLRGEIWLAALDPTVGSEIQKTRPCVIVSPDELNAHLRTVIVAPMTTGSRPAPFRVALRFKGKDGLILPDQMRTVDKVRLVKRLGRVDAASGAALLRILGQMFAAGRRFVTPTLKTSAPAAHRDGGESRCPGLAGRGLGLRRASGRRLRVRRPLW